MNFRKNFYETIIYLKLQILIATLLHQSIVEREKTNFRKVVFLLIEEYYEHFLFCMTFSFWWFKRV